MARATRSFEARVFSTRIKFNFHPWTRTGLKLQHGSLPSREEEPVRNGINALRTSPIVILNNDRYQKKCLSADSAMQMIYRLTTNIKLKTTVMEVLFWGFYLFNILN